MRQLTVGLLGGIAAIGAAMNGCSSSSSPVGAMDAAADVGMTCPVDASIATFSFPDAALGDAGGNATSCGTCLNASCASAVSACDNDCSCLMATQTVLECGADGGTAAACAELGKSDMNFVTLAGLPFLDDCATECALTGVEAGAPEAGGGEASSVSTSDASTSDAATTASDAASDAKAE